MTSNKAQLQQEINEIEKMLSNPAIPESDKQLIRPSLANAKKILAEMKEDIKEEKPIPAAVEKKAKQVVTVAKKIVKTAKAAANPKKANARNRSLSDLVKHNKLLAKYAGTPLSSLKKDADRKAKKPGSRTSATGNVYRETRSNRSDVSSKKPYLEKGGTVKKAKITKEEKSLLMIAAFYLSAYKNNHLNKNQSGWHNIESIITKFKTDPTDRGNLIHATLFMQIAKDTISDTKQKQAIQNKIDDLIKMAIKYSTSNTFAAGGPIGEGKNGYIAFYKGKQVEVMADTSYAAQKTAAAHFKAKKSYDVSVVLAELEGKQVTHLPLFAKGGNVRSHMHGELTNWLAAAIQYLKEAYGLEPNDMDLTPAVAKEAIANNETPIQWVDGYADKYDLTKREDFTYDMGIRVMKRFGYAKGGDLIETESYWWRYGGYGRPPKQFTPAGIAAFEKAFADLEKEKPSTETGGTVNNFYDKAASAMAKLVDIVSELLTTEPTSAKAHKLLQEVGIYNYKTGLLLDTKWLNEELTARELAKGGSTSFGRGGGLRSYMENNAEKIIKHYLPNAEPQEIFSRDDLINPGAYTVDTDIEGDGSKNVFINVAFGSEYAAAEKEIEADYKKYIKFLEGLGDTKGYNVEILTVPEDESVTFKFSNPRTSKYAMGGLFKGEHGRGTTVNPAPAPTPGKRIPGQKEKGGNVTEGEIDVYGSGGEWFLKYVNDGYTVPSNTVSHWTGHPNKFASKKQAKIYLGKMNAAIAANEPYQMKHGGKVTRNISRDRKFKSQQPHEQAYQRRTSPKNPKYKRKNLLKKYK